MTAVNMMPWFQSSHLIPLQASCGFYLYNIYDISLTRPSNSVLLNANGLRVVHVLVSDWVAIFFFSFIFPEKGYKSLHDLF